MKSPRYKNREVMSFLFLQKKTFFAISKQRGPLILIILIAPVPSGVEMQAIVRSLEFCSSLE